MKNENSIFKVYVFYLKKDRRLYAFTINKAYKNSFKEIRNMNKFIYEKVEMTELDLSIFQNNNYTKMLTEIYVTNSNDIKDYQTIIGTYDEEYKLESSMHDIGDRLTLCRIFLGRLKLKKEYIKSIKYLTDICNPNDKTMSNTNTLKLFYHLFKDTF